MKQINNKNNGHECSKIFLRQTPNTTQLDEVQFVQIREIRV